MDRSLDQIRLDALIERSGLNDRELAELCGVSQPTAWRLRNGKIAKVRKYVAVLDGHLGRSPAGSMSDDEMMTDLAIYARQVPALREALASLHQLIQKNA